MIPLARYCFFFLHSDGMLATADQNNYSNHLLSLFKTSQQLSQFQNPCQMYYLLLVSEKLKEHFITSKNVSSYSDLKVQNKYERIPSAKIENCLQIPLPCD